MAQRERTDASSRLPLRERLWLRRQGRLDGRRDVPELVMIEDAGAGTATTALRARLAAEFGERMAALLAERVIDLNTMRARLAPMSETIARRRTELGTARRELTAIEADRPGPDAPPERRRGDELQPDHIVRARRAREHATKEAAARAKVETLTQDLANALQDRANLVALVNALRARTRAEVAALEATARVRLARYDHALLRRHSDAELVQELLDDSLPGLPEWLAESADDAPDGQEES